MNYHCQSNFSSSLVLREKAQEDVINSIMESERRGSPRSEEAVKNKQTETTARDWIIALSQFISIILAGYN